jgi:hypothetical protein
MASAHRRYRRPASSVPRAVILRFRKAAVLTSKRLEERSAHDLDTSAHLAAAAIDGVAAHLITVARRLA